MKIDEKNIGINAGRVWCALSKYQEAITFEELMRITDMTTIEVATAIGWLARENKIIFHEIDGAIVYLSIFQETYF